MKSFPEVFDVLMDAILNNESVEIEYKKTVVLPLMRSDLYPKQLTKRLITPKKFVLVERYKSFFHRLCIDTYCHLRKDKRIFAVCRIQDIKKTIKGKN